MPDLQAIGVDIGGTHTKVALVSQDGNILRQESFPTTAHGDPQPYLERIIRTLKSWSETCAPKGIGIALPGLLDSHYRSITFNPNTPALVGLDFVNLFDQLHLPLHIEQDLNVPALAEYHFGARRGSQRLVTASIGTGLGAAVVIGGELLRFAGGTAGDTGHIILNPGGPNCTAGCHGCAEAMVSIPAIERLAASKIDDPRAVALRNFLQSGSIPARAVIALAIESDSLAVEILHEIGQWLGQWLASIAPIFLPDHIILCGGIAEAGSALLLPAEHRFRELAGPEYARCTIELSKFKWQAGVIGAAIPFLK